MACKGLLDLWDLLDLQARQVIPDQQDLKALVALQEEMVYKDLPDQLDHKGNLAMEEHPVKMDLLEQVVHLDCQGLLVKRVVQVILAVLVILDHLGLEEILVSQDLLASLDFKGLKEPLVFLETREIPEQLDYQVQLVSTK